MQQRRGGGALSAGRLSVYAWDTRQPALCESTRHTVEDADSGAHAVADTQPSTPEFLEQVE